MSRRIAIVYNTSFYIWNFRLNLIRALQEEGFEVCCIATRDRFTEKLEAAGCEFLEWDLVSSSKNPFSELKALLSLNRLLKQANPDIILCYTIKPNLYASLLWGGRRPVINNITGLGAAFGSSSGLFPALVKRVYRLALRKSYRVFLQNPDDARVFLENGIVSEDRSQLLPGSGVDIERFQPAAGAENGRFTFLLVARMIREKGVFEFIEAAKQLSKDRDGLAFWLLGGTGIDNPSAISDAELAQAIGESRHIEYLGVSDDVRREIAQAHVVVLPSYYREGVPRTLLEAAAMGKPLITTDEVGCREAVRDGENGFLCRARDAADLAAKMQRMLNLSDEERGRLGRSSREMAVSAFDERIVIGHYLDVIKGIAQAA
jgi:glycosyltransferase involved in cell wall biosynthesis